MSTATLVDKVRQAGVIGAGGAGFPTYVKISQPVETLIINGAECEPLLNKDNALMQHFTEELVQGIALLQEALKPVRTVIGIKAKNSDSISIVSKAADRIDLELFQMEDYYPAGDEVNLVYEITGKLIPPAGIPLALNIVVLNVETVINLFHASRNKPVTHSMVTVTGAVRQPVTSWLPVGLSIRKAIEFAGGTSLRDYLIIDGGPMMGRLVEDLEQPVEKTSSGFIVVPRTHGYVKRQLVSAEQRTRIGRSVCDQCNMCTQLCPRYLLGYTVEPHRVMRHQQTVDTNPVSRWGEICCECGICTLVSCPENLDPRLACQLSKQSLRKLGETYHGPTTAVPHALGEFRKLSTSYVIRRLGLLEFKKQAPFREYRGDCGDLIIRLNQHIGTKASPEVEVGDKVSADQLLASVPTDNLGVGVHSPASGTVVGINSEEIIIQ
jgi:Na+-translocating ferredoxin:NAD+ oxidoreductase RnfC subunit